MSALRVGQRVRIIATDTPNFGKETAITRTWVWVEGCSAWVGYYGHEVAITCTANPDYALCIYEPHDLEPILYDGNQLVSWEECLWQPEGQAA